MKILISPAKSLDTTTQPTINMQSEPIFGDNSVELMQHLKKMSPQAITEFMKISPKLADNVSTYNKNWQWPHQNSASKPAVYLFKGDVYLGLQAYNWDKAKAEFAQQHLNILSGLYAILRPFDMIMPYRLEMGRKLANSKGKDIYSFWRLLIKQYLQTQLTANDFIINLASNEYFAAVDCSAMQDKVWHIEFKDKATDGGYKVKSFYAKKARGLMADWLLENRITKPEQIKEFAVDNYYFKSLDNNKFTFYRD